MPVFDLETEADLLQYIADLERFLSPLTTYFLCRNYIL